MARTKMAAVPEVGDEAPEFTLPSAQGGQLRLGMRTARGPVVVAFYEGATEEEVAYFTSLAAREDEINMAAGSVVGIGVVEPTEARELVEKSGLKSYVLYDYARVATRQWGLLEKTKERGEFARSATFVVDGDHKIVQRWIGERPDPAEILAQVSAITGLPKAPEEEEKAEKPDESAAEGGEKPKKMSAEERERIKAERRAAREAGKSLKTSQPAKDGGEAPAGRERLSPEEREKRRAERRAAREAGEGNAVESKADEEPATKPEGGAAKEG